MTIRARYWAMTLSALVAMSAPAMAQDSHADHGAAAGAQQMASPASAAYRQAMDRMHDAMNAMQDSGDADQDFARGMIPHHQAAIDMARAVLEHGKDPEIRQLAEDIIEAQEREIDQLEAWLEKNAR